MRTSLIPPESTGTAFTKAVVAGDYDNDGYVDFYLSNYNGNNFLYHNNHDRTFTEVGGPAGVQDPWASFPAWFFDYDNDGWPDLFVSSYAGSSDEVMRSYLGLPANAEHLEAVPEPAQRHVSRTCPSEVGPRPGLHAHGLEFRRHRQ